MAKPAHKSGTAGQWVNPALTIKDIIEEVEAQDKLDKQTKDYLDGYDAGFRAGYCAGKLDGASTRL